VLIFDDDLIKKLLFDEFFPSSFHAQKGFSYARNNIRKTNYEQKHGMTVISYAVFTHSHSCIIVSFANLTPIVCFLNVSWVDYTALLRDTSRTAGTPPPSFGASKKRGVHEPRENLTDLTHFNLS